MTQARARKPRKKRIHVAQRGPESISEDNKARRRGTNQVSRVLTVKTSRENDRGFRVDILDPNDMDKVIASVKYTPDKPLSCGARCYIETHAPLIVDTGDGEKLIV